MNKLLLVIVIICGLAAGLLWPGRQTSATAGTAQELTLNRSSDGHFYVDADVNGQPVRFLIDTGSSMVTLTEKDAARAGLEVQAERAESLGEGASGLVRGQRVELASMQVGKMKRTDVDAAVVVGSSMSLLGQPFLDQFDEIVIRRGEMILRGR